MVLAAEGWGVLGGLMGWSPAGVSARMWKWEVGGGPIRVGRESMSTWNITFCVKERKAKTSFLSLLSNCKYGDDDPFLSIPTSLLRKKRKAETSFRSFSSYCDYGNKEQCFYPSRLRLLNHFSWNMQLVKLPRWVGCKSYFLWLSSF